jgi:hypothetical protein
MNRDMVTLEFDDLKAETDKAYLVEIDGDEYWIPKSQVEDIDEGAMVIEMTEWIALEKGLI